MSKCTKCNGKGSKTCGTCSGGGVVICPRCNGKGGQNSRTSLTGFHITGDNKWNTCTNCDGEGKLSCNICSGTGDVTCQSCGGSGYS